MNEPQTAELMKKLNKQGDLGGYPVNSEATIMTAPLDDTQNAHARQMHQGEPQTPPQPSMQPAVPVQPVTPIKPDIPIQPDMTVHTQPTEVAPTGLAAKIAAVEQELGDPSQTISTVTAKAKVFMDEYGNETFYAQNESNGHIVISDLDIAIPRAKSIDLLTTATLEDLKKSRDLRALLAGDAARPMLRRLTPEEYFERKKIELANKRKIEKMKSSAPSDVNIQDPNAPQLTPKIRPTVLSKLEKLRLFGVPENRHLGLTPIEFTEWALTENLTTPELDYIIAHPNVANNTDVLTALYEKRSKM